MRAFNLGPSILNAIEHRFHTMLQLGLTACRRPSILLRLDHPYPHFMQHPCAKFMYVSIPVVLQAQTPFPPRWKYGRVPNEKNEQE